MWIIFFLSSHFIKLNSNSEWEKKLLFDIRKKIYIFYAIVQLTLSYEKLRNLLPLQFNQLKYLLYLSEIEMTYFLKDLFFASDCAISFLSNLVLSEVNRNYCSSLRYLCKDPFCIQWTNSKWCWLKIYIFFQKLKITIAFLEK